jgi:hypothetical protein
MNKETLRYFPSGYIVFQKNGSKVRASRIISLKYADLSETSMPFNLLIDPLWDGDIYRGGKLPTKPSFLWKTPSKWMPMRHSKKCIPEIVDYTKIRSRRNNH